MWLSQQAPGGAFRDDNQLTKGGCELHSDSEACCAGVKALTSTSISLGDSNSEKQALFERWAPARFFAAGKGALTDVYRCMATSIGGFVQQVPRRIYKPFGSSEEAALTELLFITLNSTSEPL